MNRWYAVRLEARFNRLRTNDSLFSIFLVFRLYSYWAIQPAFFDLAYVRGIYRGLNVIWGDSFAV